MPNTAEDWTVRIARARQHTVENYTPAPKIRRREPITTPTEPSSLQMAVTVNSPEDSIDLVATHYMMEAHERFRYIPQATRWMKWDGHVWVWDEVDDLREDLKNFLRKGSTYSPKQAQSYAKWIQPRSMGTLIDFIKTDPMMKADLTFFDQDEYELNTPGGVVDLVTGKISEPSASRLVRRSTTVTPDANCPTPMYDDLLKSAFRDQPILSEYFDTMIGISLIKAQSEQVFIYMYGEPGSGKGTLMNLAQKILGKGESGYCQHIDSKFFVESRNENHPTEYMQFLGARMVISSEIRPGAKMDTAKLKKTTGGDPISGRYTGKDFVTFDATHTLWLQANDRLQVPEGDRGVWRRLRVLPFNHKHVGPAVSQLDGLIASDEGPGVLARWIKAASEYLTDGYYTPLAVNDAGEEYKSEQDTVSEWLVESVETENDPKDDFATTKALREDYLNWCKLEKKTALNLKAWHAALQAKGFEPSRTNSVRGYKGLRLQFVSQRS